MKTKWYIGCLTEEEKLERAALYKSCAGALKVLRRVLELDLKACEGKSRTDAAFDNAAWPYYQAKLLGEQAALVAVLELLPEDIKE